MKSLIECRKMALLIMLTIATMNAKAQVQTNPDQYIIIGEGTAEINGKIIKQTNGQGKTAVLQGTIAAEFTKMKNWEGKYISYLKTARGYAESLKAGTSIFAEGVQTLQHIFEIKRAIGANPVGMAATLSLNDLYLETASEFLKVFTTLKESVSKGGETNMLNGSERTEMLWEINDRLVDLNRKLRELAISIAYHNLTDVWNRYTAGMVQRDIGMIANEALNRWRRATRTILILNP